MFNRILVPVDGSAIAAAAAGSALALATTFDSTVIALHVVDLRLLEGPVLPAIGAMWGEAPMPVRQDDLAASLERRGRAILDDFEQRATGADRTFETWLDTGVVADVIADRARSVDLVVIGRRGEHSGPGARGLGSTVQAVVRHAPKPVLVCPSPAGSLDRVLVAWDGSEHATRALELAVAYAERSGAPLHLVTVGAGAEDARRLLDEAVAYAGGHGLAPVPHPREAENGVAESILEVAREIGADLLAMGAYGKGRLREILVGSTTGTVLERFDHPVLLYR